MSLEEVSISQEATAKMLSQSLQNHESFEKGRNVVDGCVASRADQTIAEAARWTLSGPEQRQIDSHGKTRDLVGGNAQAQEYSFEVLRNHVHQVGPPADEAKNRYP